MSPFLTDTPQYDWRDAAGEVLPCNEKRVALDDAMLETAQACRDMLDDALLLGCSQASAKAALQQMIDQLIPAVKERS